MENMNINSPQERIFSTLKYQRKVSENETDYYKQKILEQAKQYANKTVPTTTKQRLFGWLTPLSTWDHIANKNMVEKTYIEKHPTQHLNYDFNGLREEIETSLSLKPTHYELNNDTLHKIVTATNMYAPKHIQTTQLDGTPITLKMFPLPDKEHSLIVTIIS